MKTIENKSDCKRNQVIVRNKRRKTGGRRVPYFTRQLLIRASRMGIGLVQRPKSLKAEGHSPAWAHIELAIDLISEMPDLKYPVQMSFRHKPRQMRPFEPHVRCVISLAQFDGARSDFAWCDVPLEFFRKLPRMRVKRAAASARVA